MEPRQADADRQSNIGGASAIQWLAQAGYRVYVPFGNRPLTDLMAARDGGLFRIQVRTCTSSQDDRLQVPVRKDGSRDWDFLFVFVADGRRWCIPGDAAEGLSQICLGGSKYSEYEVASDT
jgi:hypothetical protein